MKINRKICIGFGLVVLAFSLVGCSSIGGTAAGASNDQMMSEFNKLSPDEQAKTILDIAGPMDAKAQKIKDIYAKAGKPIPANIQAQIGGTAQGTNVGH